MSHEASTSSISLNVEALEERRVLSTASFVTGLYTTLLHRAPGPAETAAWVAAVNSGAGAQEVALAFTASPEYLNNLVVADYQHILGRTPTPQEAGGWVTGLQNGLSDQNLVSSFLASPEYFQKAGGTNSGWINGAYNVVLGRAPDAKGEADWQQALQQGTPREAIASSIAGSAESLARTVTALYKGVLGRAVDPQGLASWTARLAQGMSPSQLEAVLASSTEVINARGGLDVVVVQPVPVLVPVPVPVVVPVDTYVYDPFFGPVGYGGCGCTTAGFGGGFTGGGSGGFGGSGS